MIDKVIKGSDDNFSEEVLSASLPVLVDFWASWCAPCRMIAPFIDQLATEYEGKLKVVKCNIDECGQVASEYQVSSIPTLMIFKNGKMAKSSTGALPLAQLKEFIDSEL